MANYEESTLLTKKIEAIVAVNAEIIQRIKSLMDQNIKVEKYDYLIEQDPSAQNQITLKVEEVVSTITAREFVEKWRIPPTAPRPVDPDPDQTLYGKLQDLMDPKCETFADLVRFNEQIRVSNKYTTMLREEMAVKYGKKFQENFEIVQQLLGMLEEKLVPVQSRKALIQEQLDDINKRIGQVFQIDGVLPISLKISSQILDNRMKFHLANMLEDPGRLEFYLVHDSTRGINCSSFGNAVKGLGPTLIVIKSTKNYVFGAYVHEVWGSSNSWIPTTHTFLFTLGNTPTSNPVKLLSNGDPQYGVYINTDCGLHVGGSTVGNNSLVAFCSHTCAVGSFTVVAPGYQADLQDTLLAGETTYQPQRMEVFHVIKN